MYKDSLQCFLCNASFSLLPLYLASSGFVLLVSCLCFKNSIALETFQLVMTKQVKKTFIFVYDCSTLPILLTHHLFFMTVDSQRGEHRFPLWSQWVFVPCYVPSVHPVPHNWETGPDIYFVLGFNSSKSHDTPCMSWVDTLIQLHTSVLQRSYGLFSNYSRRLGCRVNSYLDL